MAKRPEMPPERENRAGSGAESRRAARSNKTSEPGTAHIGKTVGGESGVRFPVHDHPDHSEVHGDGGKGCSG